MPRDGTLARTKCVCAAWKKWGEAENNSIFRYVKQFVVVLISFQSFVEHSLATHIPIASKFFSVIALDFFFSTEHGNSLFNGLAFLLSLSFFSLLATGSPPQLFIVFHSCFIIFFCVEFNHPHRNFKPLPSPSVCRYCYTHLSLSCISRYNSFRQQHLMQKMFIKNVSSVSCTVTLTLTCCTFVLTLRWYECRYFSGGNS